MVNHQIQKPKLFISHATSDGEFANAVKQEIDTSLHLPPDTAQRLLISVAQRYGLVPQFQSENVIRFKIQDAE